jgi:ABC-type branched-subunit amino acid transport system ATPase component/branched-subunit amino acid ABC-type transport system permease component
MSDILPFIIAGLVTGAVYGLAGVGLVLTYKTSGIFNFAHGTIATASAFIFYALYVRHGLPWGVAALVSIVVSGPILSLGLERLARAATGTSLAARVVATVGLLTFIQAAAVLIYGTDFHAVPGFLGSGTFRIDATAVTWAEVIILVVAVLATGALYSYFRVSRGGIAMRAVVDDPALLDLAGTNPIRVRREAWIIGSTFAALSGILLVQLLGQVDPTTFTLLVVQAFAAAALGRFTSLPLTFGGGVVLGIGTSLCTKYFHSGLGSGLASSLPFLALMAVLLIYPKSRLTDHNFVLRRVPSPWRAPDWFQAGGGVAVLAFLCCVPLFAGDHLEAWISLLTTVILFASLGLLVRTAGEVSLCQISFVAIGVAAFSHLAVQHHLPWLVALLVAALITVPVGALLAIPAIRLSGLYLALVSLGFGLVLQYMFYDQSYMFGSNAVGLTVPRPKLSWLNATGDRTYYYLVLFITVLILGVIVALTRGRMGRLLRALSASSTGLATSGASINVTLVLVFCLSAFLAAISGILNGGVIGVVSSDNYPPLLSLTYFVVIMITVGGEPWYALFAAAGLTVLPIYVTSGNIGNYLSLAFGAFAMMYVMVPAEKRGAPVWLQKLFDSAGDRLKLSLGLTEGWNRLAHARSGAAPGTAPASSAPTVPSAAPARPATAPAVGTDGSPVPGLQVSNIRVEFGGLVAVANVSLEAPKGRITGLIGPNGAGKTTLFNACSGLNEPRSGEVSVKGLSITRKGPSARARLGLGRTFQQMELFDELTVADNVALGREAGFAGFNPLTHILGSPGQRQEVAAATAEAMRLCSLELVADIAVGTLSTGQRRLVELARCLAGPFEVLLLDEPSSGLDHHETVQFGEILRHVVAERGVGVLLVEHDLELVTRVCDYMYVLEFGQLLFEGTPAEALASEAVQAAYLGTESESEPELIREDEAVLGQ